MMWWLAMILACGEEEATEKPDPQTEEAAPEAEPDDCVQTAWYADTDGDGFGDPFAEVFACEAPAESVDNHSDCDDADATEFPGAVWYRDMDGDGTGDADQPTESCSRPIGHTSDASDCDDSDGTRYPGAVWYTDADEDGFGDEATEVDACGDVSLAVPVSGDCNDADWFVHPDANEVCDEQDNNCDGLVDDDDPNIDMFTQVPMYADEDLDGWGQSDVSLGHLCAGYVGGSERYGDCDDADPNIFPHRLDYRDDVDSDCDGEPSVFYAASSEYGWSGSTTSSVFGALMTSKDIDGDGRNEVLVGAYNEGEYRGSVKYIPGELLGDRSSFPEEGRMWDGERDEDRFGFALDFAGDWDGDGVEDMVIGSSYRDEFTGLVHIVSTEMPSGSVIGATHAMQNYLLDSHFGHAVKGLGDIDGDGLDDVLIAARKDSRVNNNGGSIGVAYGGDTAVSMPADDRTIHSESNGDQFGFAIVEVGDADGDGVTDFMVGSPYCDDGVSNGGCAYLLNTAEIHEALPLEGATRFWGTAEAENAGMALGSVGDFDGDGLDDMLVGAPNHHVSFDDEGVAYVVLGSSTGWASPSLADAHLMMLGRYEGDKTGRFLGGVGDINGDGKDDVAVTSHVADLVGDIALENMGVVYGVLGGRASGVIDLMEEADFQIVGYAANDYLGRGIARAGDVDEDGIDDFWLGANGDTSYGAIYLIHGAPSL